MQVSDIKKGRTYNLTNSIYPQSISVRITSIVGNGWFRAKHINPVTHESYWGTHSYTPSKPILVHLSMLSEA